MQIRKIQSGDEAAFLALSNAFYHTDGVLHPIPMRHIRDTFAALMSKTPYVDCLIAEQDKTPVGYVLLSLTWSNEGGGLTIWVEELYVSDATRRQGVGKALLQAVHERWPEAMRFRLEVEPSNTDAMRLYTANGYENLPYVQMVRDKKIEPTEAAETPQEETKTPETKTPETQA